MKVTILSDNIGNDVLAGEWGLSFYIEYKGRRYLLDTGGSDKFIHNAEALGIDVGKVDHAVLSHAHYDHSLGMESFFRINTDADFYMSPSASENCYAGWRFLSRYIGIPKGITETYADRFRTPEGVFSIDDGVYVVPHSTSGLSQKGRKAHMYIRRGFLNYRSDDFSHEQSLVFKVDDGLVIMNSCSHAGADIIVEEVLRAFPGEKVKAYVGGLHLFRCDVSEVKKVASRIHEADIAQIFTGHCTGERAFNILREELGDKIQQFRCGKVIDL